MYSMIFLRKYLLLILLAVSSLSCQENIRSDAMDRSQQSWDTTDANETARYLNITGDTPWLVSPDEPEAIQRALHDIATDWYKVMGRPPVILHEMPEIYSGPMICFGINGEWLKDIDDEAFEGKESYRIRVVVPKNNRQGSVVVATGADMRGAIYASYTFSEDILGVDPWYFWTDHEPEYRGKIKIPIDYKLTVGPPAFKYRGWFMNDEDILAGFSPDPLRENIFSLTMWDRIFETILRVRGNMVVPGTFTFPDEKCRILASKRGLVINDHHINVVGLNTFQWPKDVPYSFYAHPEIMERAWKICIDAMKDFEMVWTVGYRGKYDSVFWADDKQAGANTPQARGKFISDAIAKQVELIREVQPAADIIANLWSEGAKLYEQGHIKLPNGVIAVWPDDGRGNILDEGNVREGQGLYYHTAMLNRYANQLTELVPPGRIFSEIGRFVQAGATEFFLDNVSDIRPVPMTTDAAMQFAWDPSPFMEKTPEQAMADFLMDWSRRQFGPEIAGQVASLYDAYFKIPYMLEHFHGEQAARTYHDRLLNAAVSLIRSKKALPQELINEAKKHQGYASEACNYIEPLAAKAKALAPRVPKQRMDFYRSHVLMQIATHQCGATTLGCAADAVLAYANGDLKSAVKYAQKSIDSFDSLFAERRKTEQGRWIAFYMHDNFIGFSRGRDVARRLLAALKGEPEPPITPWADYPSAYRDMYRYQEAGTENYPLFYPSSAKFRE